VSARVLVVDDDDVVRRSLATVLTRAGFDITTADDGEPAMALADRFDVVVVDYNMRTTTGAEVVRHYKERFGDRVYCVVLSGEGDEQTHAICVDAGADIVMQKPAPVAELRRRLTEAAAALRARA
jgi:DNA-binding response OmpR family regulator